MFRPRLYICSVFTRLKQDRKDPDQPNARIATFVIPAPSKHRAKQRANGIFPDGRGCNKYIRPWEDNDKIFFSRHDTGDTIHYETEKEVPAWAYQWRNVLDGYFETEYE